MRNTLNKVEKYVTYIYVQERKQNVILEYIIGVYLFYFHLLRFYWNSSANDKN